VLFLWLIVFLPWLIECRGPYAKEVKDFRYSDLASESLKEDETTHSDSTLGVEHSIVNCESGVSVCFCSAPGTGYG
jgi:hypothetical protein